MSRDKEQRPPAQARRLIAEFNCVEDKRVEHSSAVKFKELRDLEKKLQRIQTKSQWTPGEMASFLNSLEKYGIAVIQGGSHMRIMHNGRYLLPLPRRAAGSTNLQANHVNTIQKAIVAILETEINSLKRGT